MPDSQQVTLIFFWRQFVTSVLDSGHGADPLPATWINKTDIEFQAMPVTN